MPFHTWADEAGIPGPTTIDRSKGEGPPRCCARDLVAADALVRFSPADVAGPALDLVHARFPHAPEYLCDACRGTLRREQVIARTEMPLSRPLKYPNAK